MSFEKKEAQNFLPVIVKAFKRGLHVWNVAYELLPRHICQIYLTEAWDIPFGVWDDSISSGRWNHEHPYSKRYQSEPEVCEENTIHHKQHVKNGGQVLFLESPPANAATCELNAHSQLMNHLWISASICNAENDLSKHKREAVRDLKSPCSHRCLCWSMWCEICPCKTPAQWWRTWRWRRRAAGRSEAEGPWLSL